MPWATSAHPLPTDCDRPHYQQPTTVRCRPLRQPAARTIMLHGLQLLLGLLSAVWADSVGPGPGPSVWPKPSRSEEAAGGGAAVSFTNISFALTADSSDGVLRKAAARYRGIILAQSAGLRVPAAVPGRGQGYQVTLQVENNSVPLSPGQMKEAYKLDATAAGCTISSQSVWGALRGLETLAQLVEPAAAGFQLSPIVISDTP